MNRRLESLDLRRVSRKDPEIKVGVTGVINVSEYVSCP